MADRPTRLASFLLPAIWAATAGSAAEPLVEEAVLLDRVIAAGPDPAPARARQALLTDPGAELHEILEMPGALRTPIGVAVSPGYHPSVFASTARRLAYCNNEDCYVSAPGAAPRRIEKPSDWAPGNPAPILSGDGDWLAFVEMEAGAAGTFVEGKGTFRPTSVLLRSLKTGRSLRVPMPAAAMSTETGLGLPWLLSLDMRNRELTYYSNSDPLEFDPAFSAVRLDGAASWGPVRPEGQLPSAETFARVGDGWVAWDGHAGPGRRISWTLAGEDGKPRTGSYRLSWTELLARIDSAAVSPSGRFIAISVKAGNRLLKLPGSIRVFRSSDRSPVFSARTGFGLTGNVAFLGDEYFAYSRFDDPPGRHRTHILRLPK